MARFLEHRRREAEWMDAPDADPKLLARSLGFIRAINFFLQYTRATLGHLKRFSGEWKEGETIWILDVATGSGDVPVAIIRWAKRRGLRVRVAGVDLHHQTLLAAMGNCAGKGIGLVRGDATRLPFADGAFDYVLTSMFLHHLDEPTAVAVLAEMDRVASRGIIAADLLRSRRAYFWISLFTTFSNSMVKHDARVSVSGAFNEAELLWCCDAAGTGYLKPYRHFGHRLVLAGVKSSAEGYSAASKDAIEDGSDRIMRG
jgi:2-polyprenyl-3-methyl-5-hydroxy-6-metoxy-1,4-benzoquinol methylase